MAIQNRFESAIQKLYEAFHNNNLHPEYSDRCAVGNICDNNPSWQHITDKHGSVKLNYVGIINQNFGKRIAGYTPIELLEIEATFLKACGYELPFSPNSKRPENPQDKNIQFDGLSAVITLLCNLEGIQDIMDASKIFDFDKSTSIPAQDQVII